jgi:Cd2+/Zn2+-exporting ATPase
MAGIIFVFSLPLHNREIAFNISGLDIFRSSSLDYVEFPVFLISYVIIGWDIVWKAIRNIRRGQVFDENFLMTVATIGAFCLKEYTEGVAVMLFYQLGELFQSYAVSRSRRSIADLMDIRPDYANVMRGGQPVKVAPEEVFVGDFILIKPGERIPLDGVVTEGRSTLDTSAITGESALLGVAVGDGVISGCVNQTGMLTVEVRKEFGQSTVAKILELVENASDKKSKSEKFITRFARYYTPFVVFAAVALALMPPIVTGQPFAEWIARSLTFLVISCPCALVISIPLSFFGGIGGASKSGILIKGSNYLELLATAEIVVFDKTGTLTKGNFAVSEVRPHNMSENELIKLAACVENYSSHPIAMSIKTAYGKPVDPSQTRDIEEIGGLGVKAIIDGKEILAGNAGLMKLKNIPYEDTALAGTVVHLAVDGEYAGYILIIDEIKQDSRQAVLDLKAAGIKQTVMLTGDSDAVGRKVAAQLSLDKAYTELLPAGKVEQIEKLMSQKDEKGTLVFVGDGINDAPVLARSDIGIAMGSLGSDAAIEAADIVIMTDEPSKVATAMKISKKTLRIVRQNIVFALLVKGVVLVLGAIGYANMWGAVFSDVGVEVIAILNAIRALNVKKFNSATQMADINRSDTFSKQPAA